MRKKWDPYHGVGVAHYVQFWNPGSLLTMGTLNNEMALSIEMPTLLSHYLIVPRNKDNAFGKPNEHILERRRLQGTYEKV